jgi:hypothetical protein
MTNLKTTLDRKRLSAESIAEKQDFRGVLESYTETTKISTKLKWMYGGIIGTAVISGLFVAFGVNISTAEPKNTPENNQIVQRPVDHFVKNSNDILALSNPTESRPSNKIEESHESLDKPVSSGDNFDSETYESKENAVVEIAPIAEIEIRMESEGNSLLPRFQNYYTGEVPLDVICGNEGIRSGSNLAVVAYTISYFSGSKEIQKRIKGNAIPFDVCEDLGLYNLGEVVRVTGIVAEDRFSGAQSTLPSMHITPIDSGRK